ncbi:hypothetical protein Ancab_019148 [Ancistrocladus abbreviatus]
MLRQNRMGESMQLLNSSSSSAKPFCSIPIIPSSVNKNTINGGTPPEGANSKFKKLILEKDKTYRAREWLGLSPPYLEDSSYHYSYSNDERRTVKSAIRNQGIARDPLSSQPEACIGERQDMGSAPMENGLWATPSSSRPEGSSPRTSSCLEVVLNSLENSA